MEINPALRVRLTLVLFALCGLGIARLPVTTFGHAWKSAGSNTTARFLEKYEPLRPFLSPAEPVGYVADPTRMDLGLLPLVGRISLAQYALSPPVIEPTIQHPLVIFESDDPHATPDLAAQLGWTMIADFHNGMKLFRTAAGSNDDDTAVRQQATDTSLNLLQIRR